MDVASGLKAEIFRPAVTLAMPGLVAAAPFFYLLVINHPDLLKVANEHATLSAILGFFVATGFGLIAQEVGTFFEASFIDPAISRRTPDHMEIWYRYLRHKLPPETVARGYIHDQILFLRFELNVPPALLFFWIGILCLHIGAGVFSRIAFNCLTIGCLVGVVLFFALSFQTASNLSTVRREILKEAS